MPGIQEHSRDEKQTMNDSTMNPPPSTLRVERPKEGNAYIVNDDEDGGVKYGYNEDISHPSRASLDSNHNQHTSRRRLNVTSDAYNTNEKYLQTNVMFRPSRVLVYAPPRQRQKWGDAQVLPRVNWGDLFFDLFYVAATYNVSNIFVNAPNARGFLYAAGTFFPVMAIWNQKTFFDSRFATEADVLHRLLDGFIMIVLGVAISHIRLVSAMSNASGTDSSMLVFAMMLAIDRLFAMSLFAEVYFRGVGQRVQLKRAAFRDASFSSIALIFYVAAVIVAALDFFGNPNETGYRWLAVEEGAGVADPPTDRRNDVPIYLCLIGNITYSICYFANIVFFFPADGRHKEISGEWSMLMLGESIFSLLIVDVAREGREFFVVFYLCLSTIIFLQFLHFQSQPHGAETHAMRRNKSSGSMWSMLQQIFSFGLVMLGSTFTFFLSYAGSKNEAVGRRALLGNRMLADGSADQISQAEFQAVADLFSGTLAIVFLCLNAINLLHLGKEEVQNRCVVQGRIHWKGMGTIIVHAVLIVISSSFSQWVTEPRDLAIAGLLCVLAQLSLRKFEALHLSEKSRHRRRLVEGRRGEKPVAVATDDETGEAPWPDVTHARVEETEAPQS